MRLRFTQTHKVGSGEQIGDLGAGTGLRGGEIRLGGVLHRSRNTEDFPVRSARQGGRNGGQPGWGDGTVRFGDAPGDVFRIGGSVRPHIAGLQRGYGGVATHSGPLVPGQGVAGPFLHAGLFPSRPFQASFRHRDGNGGGRGRHVTANGQRTGGGEVRSRSGIGSRDSNVKLVYAINNRVCVWVAAITDDQFIPVSGISHINAQTDRFIVAPIIVWILLDLSYMAIYGNPQSIFQVQWLVAVSCVQRYQNAIFCAVRALLTGQPNVFRGKTYQLGWRLFLPAGRIIFDGPFAAVVPHQLQVGLGAGANELKITVSGLGCVDIHTAKFRSCCRSSAKNAADADFGCSRHTAVDGQGLILAQNQAAAALKAGKFQVGQLGQVQNI